MDFVTLNKQKSAIKSPDKKSVLADFLSRLLRSLVGSDKILSSETDRSHSSTTLVDNFFFKVNKNSA